jgi:hypothetical protein
MYGWIVYILGSKVHPNGPNAREFLGIQLAQPLINW